MINKMRTQEVDPSWLGITINGNSSRKKQHFAEHWQPCIIA